MNRHVSITLIACIFLASHIIFAQNSRRDRIQQPERIMDSIGIQEGMIIGEAGSGSGYLTFHLADRVGKTGHIYANDINDDVLGEILDKCREDSIINVSTIVGEITDPRFPVGKLDMIIMLRAFHDFAKPVEWMKNVVPALKPGATLVIVDPDPDKLGRSHDHFYTRKKVISVMDKTRFKLIRILDFLKEDNIYIFKIGESL